MTDKSPFTMEVKYQKTIEELQSQIAKLKEERDLYKLKFETAANMVHRSSQRIKCIRKKHG